MASITIEASKVARKSPIRVDSSLVGTVSGVEDVSVSLPSSKARLSVGKLLVTRTICPSSTVIVLDL